MDYTAAEVSVGYEGFLVAVGEEMAGDGVGVVIDCVGEQI